MGIKLHELLEASQLADTDLLHLRTVAGLDKKIFWANFFTKIPQTTNHIVIHAGSFKVHGASAAVVNVEGVFITLDYIHTAEREAFATQFIPFRWDSDTDIVMEMDWLCDVDATGGAVVWGVEYLSIKDNEAVDGAEVVVAQAFTGAGAGLMQRSMFTTKILKANLEHDDIMGIRIYRDHDHGSDTLDQTARFLALHMHFVRDKIGGPVE